MNKKIIPIFALMIIIILTACNDRNYITGQVGPARGIVFNLAEGDVEAKLYKQMDDITYSTAEISAKSFSVETSWNKFADGFRLPTVYEVAAIMSNRYSAALWSESNKPETSYIWCEGSIAYNYMTKKINTSITTASLLVVRDIYTNGE